jgi:hypothetical protein
MHLLNNPLIIPLSAFVVITVLLILDSTRKLRESEIAAYRDLRIREMEHLRRIKELEIEHARLASHTSG